MSEAVLATPLRSARAPGRDWLLRAALVGPLVAWMIAFYALPVVAMLLRSVAEPHWTLDNLLRLGTDGVAMHVFLITFRTAAIVTIATAVIGYPVAFALAQTSRAWANPLLLLILLPFWTSVLVRTYAWMVLLGRRGLVNEGLQTIGLTDAPLPLLYNRLGVTIGMVHVLLPFMLLPLIAAMRRIDPNLLRAGRILGANPFRLFLRVYFPLSLPGVHAGTVLVFISSLGFFITPSLLGGGRTTMAAMIIEQEADVYLDWPMASAIATVLLAFTLVLYLVYGRLARVDVTRGLR